MEKSGDRPRKGSLLVRREPKSPGEGRAGNKRQRRHNRGDYDDTTVSPPVEPPDESVHQRDREARNQSGDQRTNSHLVSAASLLRDSSSGNGTYMRAYQGLRSLGQDQDTGRERVGISSAQGLAAGGLLLEANQVSGARGAPDPAAPEVVSSFRAARREVTSANPSNQHPPSSVSSPHFLANRELLHQRAALSSRLAGIDKVVRDRLVRSGQSLSLNDSEQPGVHPVQDHPWFRQLNGSGPLNRADGNTEIGAALRANQAALHRHLFIQQHIQRRQLLAEMEVRARLNNSFHSQFSIGMQPLSDLAGRGNHQLPGFRPDLPLSYRSRGGSNTSNSVSTILGGAGEADSLAGLSIAVQPHQTSSLAVDNQLVQNQRALHGEQVGGAHAAMLPPPSLLRSAYQRSANVFGPRGPDGYPLDLPTLLGLPEDVARLSTHQVFLRLQIEAFRATEDDISTHTRGRNKPILIGQVGIRCLHCGHLSVDRRQKGSTYFPAKLLGVYQAAQNMCTTHLQCGLCPEMPERIKQEFSHLLSTKATSSGAGRPYWAGAAKALGLVDTENEGIRFIRDVQAGEKGLLDHSDSS